MDRMPEEAVACIIAHELCHVLFRTYGRRWGMDDAEEEAIEPAIALGWGFDTDVFYDWCMAHAAELDAFQAAEFKGAAA